MWSNLSPLIVLQKRTQHGDVCMKVQKTAMDDRSSLFPRLKSLQKFKSKYPVEALQLPLLMTPVGLSKEYECDDIDSQVEEKRKQLWDPSVHFAAFLVSIY
jgi:hypothetical protein